MPKVKLGKETVKLLAIFDHLPMRLFILSILCSLCFLLLDLSCRFNASTILTSPISH